MRLLRVQTSLGVSDLVREALAQSGEPWTVEDCASLAAVPARSDLTTFDAVLVQLPRPDSQEWETLESIRRRFPDPPWVVLASGLDDLAASRALSMGVQDLLLEEELTAPRLLRAIRNSLDRHRAIAGSLRQVGRLRNRQGRLQRKHRRLVQARRTARTFLAALSQEFRTPLAVIKEYASLMRERVTGPVTEEQSRLLAVIEDRTDDLQRMTDDMLNVSAIEARAMRVRRRECHVGNILTRVLPVLQQKATVHDVAFEVDVSPGLPAVFCDDEKVGRVIVNLAVNAIKFCGHPGRVTLWARPQAASSELLFGVTDNGPGIDAEHQRAIFQRFRQLTAPSVRGSTRGFGLGLTIAKQFVESNLGRLSLSSTPGAGSTFSFTLPYADPVEITRRYLARHAASSASSAAKTVTLVAVTMEEPVDVALADELDVILHRALRRNDFLLRIDLATWMLLLRASPAAWPSRLAWIRDPRPVAKGQRRRGPPPAFSSNVVGSWPIESQHPGVLAAVAALAGPKEPVPA
jgi:signal transduction histidine kinase